MNPYIALSLVDYIHLLYKGKLEKSIFTYFQTPLAHCTAAEVNLAIENLLIRYKDVDTIENTVARFIRAASAGLEKQAVPDYPNDSIFNTLISDNYIIKTALDTLKNIYMKMLNHVKKNTLSFEYKEQFIMELKKLVFIKEHYKTLQYELFPMLEKTQAPTRCTQLMWHLQDSVWPKLQLCIETVSSPQPDYKLFNTTYGPMYFLLQSLIYREEKILFPVAAKLLIP